MKLKSLALACSAALMGISAAAQAELSGNMALSTDYVWRGATQTDHQPAISGGLDYAHESGFYLGTWASNVDGTSNNSIEMDGYGGYGTEFSNGVSIDVGAIYYHFPDAADDTDTQEIYGGLGFGMDAFSADAKIWYDWDNENVYYEANVGYDMPTGMASVDTVSLGAHIGQADPDQGDSVTDYNVSLGLTAANLDWSLVWSHQDDSDINDSVFFATVSKSFDL